LICLVIGYVLAYAIAFKAGRWRNLLLVLVIAPFFTSFLLRTLSWKLILSDHGFVVSTLQNLHILGSDGRLLNTWFAVIAGIVYNFLPFHGAAALRQPGEDRRSPRRGGRRSVRLAVQGFLQGDLAALAPGCRRRHAAHLHPAAGDYINAQLLGSPGGRMVGNVIQSLFTSTGDYASAGALSMILMIMIIGLVLVYIRKSGTEELV